MFEVGFGELLMVGLVALLVIGPESLPKVARTAGLWVGRARRTFAAVKADIERELRAEEMKEFMRKQALSNPLEELIEEGNAAFKTPSAPASQPAAAKQSNIIPSTSSTTMAQKTTDPTDPKKID
jgi:sec-independent protein translocase protein TatB